jgi:hypothetical protein
MRTEFLYIVQKEFVLQMRYFFIYLRLLCSFDLPHDHSIDKSFQPYISMIYVCVIMRQLTTLPRVFLYARVSVCRVLGYLLQL